MMKRRGSKANSDVFEPQVSTPARTARRTILAAPFITAFVSAGALPTGKTLEQATTVTAINGNVGEVLVDASLDSSVAGLLADPNSLSRTALSSTIDKRAIVLSEAPLDPARYGAVGDWSGSTGTDDTAAIQKAINTVAGDPNGVLRLSRSFYIPGGVTIPDEMTILGDGVGELHGGASFTGATLVNVSLPAVGKRFTMHGVRRITLPDASAGTVMRLKNVRGTIDDGTISGGKTAIYVDSGTNETFFSRLLLRASEYVMDTMIDTANAENSLTNVRFFGAGLAVKAAFRGRSINGGDIGGWYWTDVIAAMANSCEVGLLLDGSAAVRGASHPFIVEKCAFDSVKIPFRLNKWGNISFINGWTYATGSHTAEFTSANDVLILGSKLKGGGNAYRFEGGNSTRVQTLGNRYPDATTLYSFSATGTADNLMPDSMMDSTGALTTNDIRKFTDSVRRTSAPIHGPSRYYGRSTDATGDQLYINELSQTARLRKSPGSLTFRNADGGLANLTISDVDGAVQARGPLGSGAYSTGVRPSASSAGVGRQIFDTTLGKPVWSDGSRWRDASGKVV